MEDRISVYTFHSSGFAPAGDTVVSAALMEDVLEAYGGGGHQNTDGLVATFGGAAVFRVESGTEVYLGV